MTPLDRRHNRTWNWNEVFCLAGLTFVGFWLLFLLLAERTGGAM